MQIEGRLTGVHGHSAHKQTCQATRIILHWELAAAAGGRRELLDKGEGQPLPAAGMG